MKNVAETNRTGFAINAKVWLAKTCSIMNIPYGYEKWVESNVRKKR
jgi:hypothetical protein